MDEKKIAVTMANICARCETVISERTTYLSQENVDNELKHNAENFFLASSGSTPYRWLNFSTTHKVC